MKALILGGSGFFGSLTLKRLRDGGLFRELHIGSRNIEKASEICNSLGRSASSIPIDYSNPESLDRAVSAVDLVISTTGKSLQTTPPVIRSAIRQKTPYVDISVEVGVFQDAESLSDEIAAAGIPVILGAGIHPGVTELLAQTAARELDEVKGVEVFIIGPLKDYGDPERFIPLFESGWNGVSGLQTLVECLGTPAIHVRNGERRSIEVPADIRSTINPEGIAIDMLPFASFEPLSIHRQWPSADTAVWLGLWPSAATRELRSSAIDLVNGDAQYSTVFRHIWELAAKDTGDLPKVHFWAKAQGIKNGAPHTVTAFSLEDWASNRGSAQTTANVLTFTVEAIASARVGEIGLLTPLDLFEPQDVFAAAADYDHAEVHVTCDE